MLNNNKEYNARIIGTDANTDLALLKVEADGLPFLTFGNSDSLRVGEWVVAIGNPFRLQSTVTAGIVSAKARNINVLEDRGIESFIQTDAAVNPGNSGGALVSTRGDLVGINAAILSETGKYEGFSFAIPANLAKKVISDLRQFGAVQRGWMGVELQNVNDERAQEQRLPEVMGVYVALVNKNGAADEAGIKSGDIITTLNGNKIKSLPSFMEKIGQLRPGDKINLEYYRDAIKRRVTVILRNQLNTTDFIAVRKDKILTDIGFELRNLDSYEKSKYQTNGVMVVSVYKNSLISKSRLEPGFVITKISNNNVTDVNTIVNFLDQRKGTVVLEGFYENYPGEFPYTFELQ
jgi:S1-C subfamily serine protease